MSHRAIIISLAALMAGCFAMGMITRGHVKDSTTLAGAAVIVDGDTIRIGEARIRIFGIDAPESKQYCQDGQGVAYACGRRATEHMESITHGMHVECTPVGGHDRYGRVVASCAAIPGSFGWRTIVKVDLGEEMVRSGWATDYTAYSKGKYAAAEQEAAKAKRGIHAGTFESPQQFRSDHRGRR